MHRLLCLTYRRIAGRDRAVRPPFNKELFPAHCPSGPKRADWNFFSSYFTQKNLFFYSPPPPLYILVYKKKIPTDRLAIFLPTRWTGNDYSPIRVASHCIEGFPLVTMVDPEAADPTFHLLYYFFIFKRRAHSLPCIHDLYLVLVTSNLNTLL